MMPPTLLPWREAGGFPACLPDQTGLLLDTFKGVSQQVVGDRARPLNDLDHEHADDLLDAFSLDEVLPLLRHYFECDNDVLRDQAHSFTYFCAYVHVMAAQDVAHEPSDRMTNLTNQGVAS